MKHALSTHLIANHRLTTAWLDRVWGAGIPAIEIFCARQSVDYRNPAQISELGHWFRDSELELWSVHAPMHSDDCWGRSGPNAIINLTETSKPKRIATVDEIKRALEIAEKVPFRYLIQHIGVVDEEWDEHKVEAAFTALEDIKVFAAQRGVDVLLENIPNGFSSSDRLKIFLETTHLDIDFCFDVGHAHLMEGVGLAFERMKERIRSTHLHANNGVKDAHLFPYLAEEDALDWPKAMELLRSREDQYPLLLELREVEGMDQPLVHVQEVFNRLENE